jgi:L-ribulokinase
MAFTIGIDYGTNSVRAIVVDCSDGREVGSCVTEYPSNANGKELGNIDKAKIHPDS